MRGKHWLRVWAAPLALAGGLGLGVPGIARAAGEQAANTCAAVTACDAGLAETVRAMLAKDPMLPNSNITVAAQDGVVYLRGIVNGDSDRARAIREARAIPGVTAVVSDLTVIEVGDY